MKSEPTRSCISSMADSRVEIAKRSRLVSALVAPKTFTRYYFSTDSARNAAIGLKKGVR